MMINAMTAPTNIALNDAASAAEKDATDFASLMEAQRAATPGAVALEADEAHKTDEDEADATLATLAAGLNEALTASPIAAALAGDVAASPLASDATALHRHADTLLTLADGATATSEHQRAVHEMLQTLGRPQPEQRNVVANEASTQPNAGPGLFIKPALNDARPLQNENSHPTLTAEPPASTPTSAVPAFTLASLATPAAATPVANAMQPVAQAALAPEVGTPAWQQALGQQLSTFTRNGIQHAELRLHPEHLGPLKVNLRLQHDLVQLHFVTDQQPVRAALEAAMPHLRTSLAESGIQLDQGSVGSDAPAWGSAADADSDRSSRARHEENGAAAVEREEETTPQRIYSRTGISIFA